MRALKILGAGLGLLIVLVGVLLAVGIPGGLLTDVIQNRIERQTGYRLEIDSTLISLRPSPTVHLRGISLSDPSERDNSLELEVDEITAQMSLADLLHGKTHIDELSMVNPVLHAKMHRERAKPQAVSADGAPAKKTMSSDRLLTVGHLNVQNGIIVLADKRRNIENRLDRVALDLAVNADRTAKATFSANAGGQALALEAGATIPDGPLSGLVVPVNFTFNAPGVLRDRISAAAQVKLDGSTILINALNGTVDGGKFSGDASVEVEGKPLIKANLDIERISVKAAATGNAAASGPSQVQASPAPWSDKPFDIRGLNYLDAQAHVTIGTLNLDSVQIAPVEVDGTIADGVVRATFSKMGIYEGLAAAGAALDASSEPASFAVRSELRQVRALPLLSNAADFTALDGKLDATINVQAIGGNPRDVVASLTGMTVVSFQNGEIRGINVAKMIRSLTASTLSGWQDSQSESTDLTELGATFRIDKGQAMTQDLHLAGPLVRMTGIGTVDLSSKAINFRVEPKLVMTLQGQGGAADPVGLGVPVMVQGPWNKPRIFPDVAGILDNPDGAYAQLRQLGQGLFGSNFLQQLGAPGGCATPGTAGAGPSAANSNTIINNIGAMIQQFATPPAAQGGGPAPAAGAGQNSAGQQAATAAPCNSPAAGQPTPGGQQGGAAAAGQPGNANAQDQLNQIIKNVLGR